MLALAGWCPSAPMSAFDSKHAATESCSITGVPCFVAATPDVPLRSRVMPYFRAKCSRVSSPGSDPRSGEQYVIVPVGWGGAFRLWSPSTMMVTPTSKYGPSRLLAFKLGGQQPFPVPKIQIPEVPRPPEQTFTAAQVKSGEAL